jgi:hypothetical protein
MIKITKKYITYQQLQISDFTLNYILYLKIHYFYVVNLFLAKKKQKKWQI